MGGREERDRRFTSQAVTARRKGGLCPDVCIPQEAGPGSPRPLTQVALSLVLRVRGTCPRTSQNPKGVQGETVLSQSPWEEGANGPPDCRRRVRASPVPTSTSNLWHPG